MPASWPQAIHIPEWKLDAPPLDAPRYMVATALVQAALEAFGGLLDRALQL